ncbi:MAG: hypothetical protein MST02_03635, partial [Enterocloster clostridioformis]|nr:hypothetical protein [Enterocloster clostridioformis]
GVKAEMSIGILLYLDLEFWEGTLKTLTPSLQENAKYFTTRSYLTLTVYGLFFSSCHNNRPPYDNRFYHRRPNA